MISQKRKPRCFVFTLVFPFQMIHRSLSWCWHLESFPCWSGAAPYSEMTRGKILTEGMTLSDRGLHCSIMQLFILFMPSLISNTWPKTYQNSKSHASAGIVPYNLQEKLFEANFNIFTFANVKIQISLHSKNKLWPCHLSKLEQFFKLSSQVAVIIW